MHNFSCIILQLFSLLVDVIHSGVHPRLSCFCHHPIHPAHCPCYLQADPSTLLLRMVSCVEELRSPRTACNGHQRWAPGGIYTSLWMLKGMSMSPGPLQTVSPTSWEGEIEVWIQQLLSHLTVTKSQESILNITYGKCYMEHK